MSSRVGMGKTCIQAPSWFHTSQPSVHLAPVELVCYLTNKPLNLWTYLKYHVAIEEGRQYETSVFCVPDYWRRFFQRPHWCSRRITHLSGYGLFLEVYAVLQGVTKSIRQSGDCFWSSQNPWFGKNSFSSKLPSRLQWICSSSWHSCRSIQYRSIWQSPILLATTMMMWTSCFSEILRKTRKYKAGLQPVGKLGAESESESNSLLSNKTAPTHRAGCPRHDWHNPA